MALVPVDSTYGALIELEDIGKSPESLARLVESQKELFHSQIDHLQKIVVTQCKLTGANPLAQEMAAGALSIKIGKRPRDLLNPKAVKYMQSIFSIKDTIGKKETREISALCGITFTQVRDYFSSQRSRVRKLVRLSHEKETKCGASKATTDGCSISSNQSVPASKDIPVSTSDLTVVGDCAQNPVNSENVTSVYTQYPATPEKAIPVGTQLISNPSNFSSICSQIPGNSGNVTTVCTQVPGYSGNITTVCTQAPGNLVNATPISMLAPGNSGNITTEFTPSLGYSGIVTSVGTLVPGSFMIIAPVKDGQLGPMKINPKPVEEGPSCSLQEETSPCVDSDDKKFLENIFNLMRKEQTFSGWVKLMEWVLQIHNSAVLSWFSTKGGITILATWLSEAATEEQTTVLLVIFKVLCHLPLSKAQPEQMSAIVQTVNRLRFYRSSDISNRAKVLLSRWSKMFVRSQALRNSRKSLKIGQKETINRGMKQRTNEVLGDESWESKLCIPDEILALTESAEDSREAEPKKALKLLIDSNSSDGSTRKHNRSVSATKTKERRKILLVERPDSKTGRSTPGARAVPSNHSRPMSADDIQKAKMRAIHMQDKYGKSNAPASENSPPKTEDLKSPPVSQVPANKIPQLPQPKRNEVKKSPPAPTAKSLSHKPETSTSSNPKPNLTTQEQLLEKLKKDQVPWCTPPEVRMNSPWRVGAGENSKEVQVQNRRNKREEETCYPNPHDIPPNPKEPWDAEMDFDDSLTPETPIEQPPDLESHVAIAAEAPLCAPIVDDGAENVAPVGTSSAVITETVAPPATTTNGIPEPDAELLMVLLKNPDVVEALTRGEGRNLTEEQLVALLDMVKRAGTGVTGILDGLANGSGVRPREPEPESFSLPSPTPPNATRIGWRSEFPSHASTSAPPSQFSGNHRGTPVVPLVVMPMGVNNQSATPMAVNNHTRSRSQSQPQLTVTINSPPQLHQPVPNLYPTKLPLMYPPPVQQSRALETITPSNQFPVNHPSLQPLHPGPSKPLLPIHSEPAVFIPQTPAWPPADPMLEYRNGRSNSAVDDLATHSNYYANHNNYNHNNHHRNMYPIRNEYVPRPGMGMEMGSPEDSPVVSLPEFREFPYDRRDYSEEGREFDQRNEWSRKRQWSSAQQGQYRGGGSGSDRRWRDRDRGR